MDVKIIEDSLSPAGVRLTTFQLRYQRFIHAELMTHRVFSRNASSSRAIPVKRMLEQVRNEPAMPVHWGANQPGMQAGAELEGDDRVRAMELWDEAAWKAAEIAERMQELGLHKQVANRILEPFQFINVVVSATDWDNFFHLRAHPDAQPEFQALAYRMLEVMTCSEPVVRSAASHHESAWHLPYVSDIEREQYAYEPRLLAKMSSARCARASYNKHDGTRPEMEEDLALFERLVGSDPKHASPTEHQAFGFASEGAAQRRCRNFRGWRQFRAEVELGAITDAV